MLNSANAINNNSNNSVARQIEGENGPGQCPSGPVFRTLKMLFQIIKIILINSIKTLLPGGMLPRKNVANDIVLITGSGGGLGRILAERFAHLRVTLVLWDINKTANEITGEMAKNLQYHLKNYENTINGGDICGLGAHNVYTYTVDLSKRKDIGKVAEQVRQEVGRVDMLINNAGVTTKEFLGPMVNRNHGHIVSVASLAGTIGLGQLTDYCASKFGAVGFSESLAAELYSKGTDSVFITTVCPCYIDTGKFDGARCTILPVRVIGLIGDMLGVARSMEKFLNRQNNKK